MIEGTSAAGVTARPAAARWAPLFHSGLLAAALRSAYHARQQPQVVASETASSQSASSTGA